MRISQRESWVLICFNQLRQPVFCGQSMILFRGWIVLVQNSQRWWEILEAPKHGHVQLHPILTILSPHSCQEMVIFPHAVLPGLSCWSPNEFGLSAHRCLICINIHHVVLSFRIFARDDVPPLWATSKKSPNLPKPVAEVSGPIVHRFGTNSTLNAIINSSQSFSHSKRHVYPMVITHSASCVL